MFERSALNLAGVLMKGILATTLMVLALWPADVHAAVNQATDPGGGGVSLSNSGNVTVTSATLQLVKQVWDSAGSNCLASIPADATCNSSATSITVPTGTTLKFLIYVKNASDVSLSDVRIQDLLDDSVTGFTYTASSIRRTPNDGTAPADTATNATIQAAATTAQTDAVGAPDDFASITDSNANGKLDKLTVGAVTGQANQSLGFLAHKTFAIAFQVTKN